MRLLSPTSVVALTLLALAGCATPGPDAVMQGRSPGVLLTSYAIANGMAEHGLISRILRKQATRSDIATLIAIDHNTWIAIRQAARDPSEANFRKADNGIARILAYATPVSAVASHKD